MEYDSKNLNKFIIILFTYIFMASLAFAQEVPSYILDKIKQKAEREWPNDYLMQKHTIDTQVKKYIEVENYSDSRMPYNILDKIFQLQP